MLTITVFSCTISAASSNAFTSCSASCPSGTASANSGMTCCPTGDTCPAAVPIDCVEATAATSSCTACGQELYTLTTAAANGGAACTGSSTLCGNGDTSLVCGMCSGNTAGAGDYTCTAGVLTSGSATIAGSDDATCCACAAGYSGVNCATNIDECAAGPCANSGTCTDGVDSYSCACAAGYSGTNCTHDMDECASNPCQNGGTCVEGVASYACSCTAGFAGATDCQPCLAGYSATTAQTACTACVPGQYQPEQGNTSCLSCWAGAATNTLTEPGSTSCVACVNQFSSSPIEACAVCPANSHPNNTTNATSCTCNAGFAKASAHGACIPCGDCGLYPPAVSVYNLSTDPSKVNPSTPLLIQGAAVIVDATQPIILEWSLWLLQTASSALPIDLTQPGMVSSTTDGFNLVIAADVLQPGASYLVRLTATSDVSGSAEMTFATNSPPANGSLSVLPRTGTSLVDTFTMLASGWQDEDMPLTYTFTVLFASGQVVALSASQANSTTQALLPPCASANTTHTISVRVADALGAFTQYSNHSVAVLPYTQSENMTWMSVAVDSLEAVTDASASIAVPILNAIATNLNLGTALSENTGSFEYTDKSETRQMLVTTLSDSLRTIAASSLEHSTNIHTINVSNTSTLDESVVAMLADSLQVITAAPEQLTAQSVDIAISVLQELTGESVHSLSSTVATSLAATLSSLVQATESSAKITTYDAATRIESVFEIMSSVGTKVASGLVVGSVPVVIRTVSFDMEVQAIGTSSAGASDAVSIGGGAVRLPALPSFVTQASSTSSSGSITAQVMHWPRSPFSFANETMLGSDVVSIRLFARDGEQLIVHNLSQPIEVVIGLAAPADTTTEDCGTLACVNAYDRAQQTSGSCDALLESGYTCQKHFCHNCSYATFCRRSCAASATCSTRPHNTTCTLRRAQQCSYFDTVAGAWKVDGTEVLPSNGDNITCAFSHLTSFGSVLGPPVESNELQSLSEMLSLVGWANNNPFGLAVVLILMTATCLLIIQSHRHHKHLGRLMVFGFHINDTHYVRALTGHLDQTKPLFEYALSTYRARWSCIAAMWPHPGDPHTRVERLSILLNTCILTLCASVYFFSPAEGEQTACEADASNQALEDTCKVYQCGKRECQTCVACGGTGTECPSNCVYAGNELRIALLSFLCVKPCALFVRKMFTWLHEPTHSAIRAHITSATATSLGPTARVPPAANAVRQPIEKTKSQRWARAASHARDLGTTSTVQGRSRVQSVALGLVPNAVADFLYPQANQRRSTSHWCQHRLQPRRNSSAAVVVHTLTLLVTAAGTLFIALVTRGFTSKQTLQWLVSAGGALFLKVVQEPLLVLISAPVSRAWARYRSQQNPVHLQEASVSASTGTMVVQDVSDTDETDEEEGETLMLQKVQAETAVYRSRLSTSVRHTVAHTISDMTTAAQDAEIVVSNARAKSQSRLQAKLAAKGVVRQASMGPTELANHSSGARARQSTIVRHATAAAKVDWQAQESTAAHQLTSQQTKARRLLEARLDQRVQPSGSADVQGDCTFLTGPIQEQNQVRSASKPTLATKTELLVHGAGKSECNGRYRRNGEATQGTPSFVQVVSHICLKLCLSSSLLPRIILSAIAENWTVRRGTTHCGSNL